MFKFVLFTFFMQQKICLTRSLYHCVRMLQSCRCMPLSSLFLCHAVPTDVRVCCDNPCLCLLQVFFLFLFSAFSPCSMCFSMLRHAPFLFAPCRVLQCVLPCPVVLNTAFCYVPCCLLKVKKPVATWLSRLVRPTCRTNFLLLRRPVVAMLLNCFVMKSYLLNDCSI